MPIRFGFLSAAKLVHDVIWEGNRSYLLPFPCDTNDCAPFFGIFPPGKYHFEAWGAESGFINPSTTTSGLVTKIPDGSTGGLGSYVEGNLELLHSTTLYFHIGKKGNDNYISDERTYGGGGHSSINGAAGGGSTDIRLKNANNHNWSDFQSLKSRILAASGGGAPAYWYAFIPGGNGGSLIGKDGSTRVESGWGPLSHSEGAPQDRGGQPAVCTFNIFSQGIKGEFGLGGYGTGNGYSAGSGGGYFGGGGSATCQGAVGSGAGGSSFLSGYPGCNAIDKRSSDFGDITMTNQPIHYSNLIFTDGKMLDSSSKEGFLSPEGNKIEKGHQGNGAIRVKVLEYYPTLPFTQMKMKMATLQRASLRFVRKYLCYILVFN